jgi:hypothetical protein
MRYLYKATAAVCLLAAAMCLMGARPAEASHFRYGILTWEPTGTPGEIRFMFTAAFRRAGSYAGTGEDGYAITGDIIEEHIGATGLDFGDGFTSGTLSFRITAYDLEGDWLIGVAIDPITEEEGFFIPIPIRRRHTLPL